MEDVQTINILSKAKKMHEITQDKLARKVLEIDISAESAKNENLLSRLIRSLDQYVNKEKNIIYFGLVGHYSSGKSSTLNSLLEIDNSSLQRDTGLNPTDKAITLITHPRNSNSLILMNNEGGDVPVRSLTIEHKMLRNIVISDTPGSGDPHVVNEMMQDFLPICDVVFYFISATNPIDQADLPLLIQKSKKLPFIPLKYVITRADEFRKDRLLAVSADNIDHSKKDLFTGKLIARLNQIFPDDKISPESFIFIDNESKYNIETLRGSLLSSVSNLDSTELVKIHSHKLIYYRSNLNDIYNFYIKVIDEKIRQSKGYEKTASENIVRFDKSVEINNEKLRLFWNQCKTQFKEKYNEECQKILTIKNHRYPKVLGTNRELNSIKLDMTSKIEGLSNGYHGKILQDLNASIKEHLREVKHSVIDNVNQRDLLSGNISYLFPSRIGLSSNMNKVEIDYSKLDELLASFSSKVKDIVRDTGQSIKYKVKQFELIACEEVSISSLDELYNSGRIAIEDNFNQYFERIQMYRSTVLTRNTKETIEKLRIGTQLDELDNEFEEGFMTEMKSKAVESIYFDKAADFNRFRTTITDIIAKVKIIKLGINKIIIPGNGQIFLGKGNIDVSDKIGSMLQSKEENINSLYQERVEKALNEYKTTFDNNQKSLSEKKKNRNRNIIKWTLLAGLAFMFGFIILNYLNVLNTTSFSFSVIASIVANFIGSSIGYIVAKFRNDKSKIQAQSNEEFLTNRKVKLLQDFNENFWNELVGKSIEDVTITPASLIKSEYLNMINVKQVEVVNSYRKVHDSLLEKDQELNILIQEYLKELETYYGKFSPIFSETDRNSESLSVVAKHIKEISIKPSFDLLEETTKDLETVKVEIKNITPANANI